MIICLSQKIALETLCGNPYHPQNFPQQCAKTARSAGKWKFDAFVSSSKKVARQVINDRKE